MAKCEQCIPDIVLQHSQVQPAPTACEDCGRQPAYWYQPTTGLYYK